MDTPILDPCPFCGGKPTLRAENKPEGSNGTMWCFIYCTCRARPHVGEGRSTFYYKDADPYTPIRHRSNEDALNDAIEAAAIIWNTRK